MTLLTLTPFLIRVLPIRTAHPHAAPVGLLLFGANRLDEITHGLVRLFGGVPEVTRHAVFPDALAQLVQQLHRGDEVIGQRLPLLCCGAFHDCERSGAAVRGNGRVRMLKNKQTGKR